MESNYSLDSINRIGLIQTQHLDVPVYFARNAQRVRETGTTGIFNEGFLIVNHTGTLFKKRVALFH
jgi:hypothetical protein